MVQMYVMVSQIALRVHLGIPFDEDRTPMKTISEVNFPKWEDVGIVL